MCNRGYGKYITYVDYERGNYFAYRAGLAEGFRRGVQAAADFAVKGMTSYRDERGAKCPGWYLADKIRALRPEEDKT